MAAPRAEIPIVVLSEASPTSPVAGATAFVKNRKTNTLVSVFSDSGATNNTIAQPLTTNNAGMITGWLPRGAYSVEITVSGKTPYVENLDIAPGSDEAVEASWLASESVTGTKIAAAIKDASAATASLRTLGTGATQAAAGNDSRLSNERTPTNTSVTTAKLVDGSVTEPKLGNTSVTAAKIANNAVGYNQLALEQRGVAKAKFTSTEETVSLSTTFGSAPTPDKIESIVVPEKSIIRVLFFALWTALGTQRASIHINGKQLRVGGTEGWWLGQSASGEASSGSNFKVLTSYPGGLASVESTTSAEAPPSTGYAVAVAAQSSQGIATALGPLSLSNDGPGTAIDHATTGESLGGWCEIIVPAGTYSIEVKYASESGSGSLKVKNRRLYVLTQEFA